MRSIPQDTLQAADNVTLPLARPLAKNLAFGRGLLRAAQRAEIDSMTDSTDPAATRPPAPRRFRASDVAEHLDMAVIGDICVGVSLAGYRSVVGGFLADDGGSLRSLIDTLARADTPALAARAHAVKGAAASMGLRAIHTQAAALEAGAADLTPAECHAAASALQERVDLARALLQRMGFL